MSKNCNAKLSVANFSSPDENMVMWSEDFFSKTLILAFEFEVIMQLFIFRQHIIFCTIFPLLALYIQIRRLHFLNFDANSNLP